MALDLDPPKGEPVATLFGMPPELARADLEKSLAEASKRLGFSDQSTDPLEVPENDVDVLRRLLKDQRRATIQAREDAAVLQEQLSKALADAKGTHAKEAIARLRPDALLIKAQWERTQKDLQRALVSHQRASSHATSELAHVTEALRVAKDASSRESVRVKRQFRARIWYGVAAGAVVVTAVLTAILWPHAKLQIPAAPAQLSRAEVPALPAPRVPVNTPPTSVETAPKSNPAPSDFSQGVSRLSRAFDRFPGWEPEAVMRTVNQKAPQLSPVPCAFRWNGGEPALEFGDGQGGNRSLSGSLSRCAEAVERYR